MFEEIGNVSNRVDAEGLRILPLFRHSVSEICLNDPESLSVYFDPAYSHYIIVHTPLDLEYPESKQEWTRRFCGDLGVSLVELIKTGEESVYVRGLMAVNGSKVYASLPYTHLDSDRAKDAVFPEDHMRLVRKEVLPPLYPEIKGKSILDIGCGFGHVTLELAGQNPDSKVYGIDIHDSLTGQARMNADILEVPNVEFRTGSAYALPFEDKSIETASCFFMLHHLEDIKFALSEIGRVLKSGGQLFAVEPLGGTHRHGPQLLEDGWRELFEGAGFEVEAESREGAVVLRAIKKVL